jgi:hypothetical protein
MATLKVSAFYVTVIMGDEFPNGNVISGAGKLLAEGRKLLNEQQQLRLVLHGDYYAFLKKAYNLPRFIPGLEVFVASEGLLYPLQEVLKDPNW